MTKSGLSVPEILAALESRYGKQEPSWPTDPYLFLVWWHCGYPAGDTTCARGWAALTRDVGVGPEQLLAKSRGSGNIVVAAKAKSKPKP